MKVYKYPKILPGDIICIYRKKYNGPFKYLVTRLILFFTTEWWKGEPTSTVYHAEMAYKQLSDEEFKVVTMEPPICRFKDRSYNRKIIFRLKNRSPKFDTRFQTYLTKTVGKRKYDFIRIICFILDWCSQSNWFTDHWSDGIRDVCSEYVARFYRDYIFIDCSGKLPNSTAPDHIRDYCIENSNLFEKIWDKRY